MKTFQEQISFVRLVGVLSGPGRPQEGQDEEDLVVFSAAMWAYREFQSQKYTPSLLPICFYWFLI